MGYAFISYNHRQQTEADTLREILNLNGIRTWMAPGDIPPGSDYDEEIVKAIENCSCFILILTVDSMNSRHVKNELPLATDNSKPIFPIEFEDIVLSQKFKYHLSTSQIIKVETIDLNSEEIRKLLSRVFVCTSGDPDPAPATAPQETPKQAVQWSPGAFPGGTYQNPWTGSFQAGEIQGQAAQWSSGVMSGFTYPVPQPGPNQVIDLNGQAVPVYIPPKQAEPIYSAGSNGIPDFMKKKDSAASAPETPKDSYGVPSFLKKKKDPAVPAPETPKDSYGVPSFLKKKKDPAAPAREIPKDFFKFRDPSTAAAVDTLIKDIAEKEFTIESYGYSREQVDDLLDEVCDKLGDPGLNCLTMCDVMDFVESISPEKEKRGYSVSEVNAYLREINNRIIEILTREQEHFV